MPLVGPFIVALIAAPHGVSSAPASGVAENAAADADQQVAVETPAPAPEVSEARGTIGEVLDFLMARERALGEVLSEAAEKLTAAMATELPPTAFPPAPSEAAISEPAVSSI